MIKASLWIGFVQTRIAQKDLTLEQLFSDYELPALDVSLAAHEKMLCILSVRVVWERLEIGLRLALR